MDALFERLWLASIIAFSSDAIYSTNLDGIITSWNKSAERLYGYFAEETIGQPALCPTWGMRTLSSGPTVILKPDLAQSVAVVLHELATNAAKYGALSVPEGQVRVEWSCAEGVQLMTLWTEAGGPQVKAPTRKGFGTSAMETLIRGGVNGRVRLDWRAQGLSCEIAVPR